MRDPKAKWLFDAVLSLLGLLLFSPILSLIAISIRTIDGRPILYRGLRVGRGGRRFRILKFRTMVNDADKTGPSSAPANDPRTTRTGKFLRKYKLDELPQLINVLKGEMSLVGPRPQVPWAVELYSDEERKLLDVKPGITDYASIKFRDEAEILRDSVDPDADYLEKIAPEKIRLGLQYVDQGSLRTDVRIIFMTIRALFERRTKTEA
ncbi:MAG TPA: sugar transferase [Syntrophorhabdaceae bacterium]|nr:sugar transferase [Syntrophorhabdaceae bacterium]